MKKKVMVTGSTGLLGTSLVPILEALGHQVITHARSRQAQYMFDLSDYRKCELSLDAMQPDVIINLAGLTNVDLCENQLNVAYLVNTRVCENLARWIRMKTAQCHLVQISTDHVYDGPGLHAEDVINIVNQYAFSKYAGELAASSVPSTILRTNFIGRSKIPSRQSFTDWVYGGVSEGRRLQLLDDVYFSPLSITVLSEMIALVVDQKPVGVYNLGSNEGMSKADLAISFAESINLSTESMSRIGSGQAEFLKVARPTNMLMDNSKIENKLGLKMPSLHQLIENIAEEYRALT